MKKRILRWLSIIGALLLLLVLYFIFSIYIPSPEVDETFYESVTVKNPEQNFYTYNDNWLKKNKYGLWEMYVAGKPFERGVINGKLSKHLVVKQEEHFVGSLKKMIPSSFYINFLKYFVAWFNRDLDENIADEYKKEIYGVSKSASEEFDYIGPGYYRLLNYHAAHDIGHLVQELHMVGCTSFASWGAKSQDSTLIVGRNFDFFVGDEFAEEKIVAFINPDSGYKFMMVTWGGMIGAVSGMNNEGLTVTINAARSEMPTSTATPISIVAREVLQYASDIDDAYKIISKRSTFVGQSFLVASAKDNKAVVIEKTPHETALYSTDTNYIFCSNHYQSKKLRGNQLNQIHIKETSTAYRYERIKQLVDSNTQINVGNTVDILRDTRGVNNKFIGYGNERALNQLQGHHSIIFKPAERLVWVSTAPWQAGKYVAYNLKTVFDSDKKQVSGSGIVIDSLVIPEDSLIYKKEFNDYLKYRELKLKVEDLIRNDEKNDKIVEDFLKTNQEYYLVYQLSGDYYYKYNLLDKARECYQKALSKTIAWKADSLILVDKMKEIEENQEQN